MNLVKLTPENVESYIGFNIIFKTGGVYVIKKILGCADSCESIRVDFPRLNNNLEIKGRVIKVIQE